MAMKPMSVQKMKPLRGAAKKRADAEVREMSEQYEAIARDKMFDEKLHEQVEVLERKTKKVVGVVVREKGAIPEGWQDEKRDSWVFHYIRGTQSLCGGYKLPKPQLLLAHAPGALKGNKDCGKCFKALMAEFARSL